MALKSRFNLERSYCFQVVCQKPGKKSDTHFFTSPSIIQTAYTIKTNPEFQAKVQLQSVRISVFPAAICRSHEDQLCLTSKRHPWIWSVAFSFYLSKLAVLQPTSPAWKKAGSKSSAELWRNKALWRLRPPHWPPPNSSGNH